MGASKGTGALAVRAALARGHEVTAFARHPERLVMEDARLARRSGDFHDTAAVRLAVPGHDAVIVTASATSLRAFEEDPNYFSRGTALVVEAMRTAGVRRLVVLSAFGVGETRPLVGFLMGKLMMSWLLKVPFEDHARQEALVRESKLDWVIARPTRLTNRPAHGRFRRTAALERVPSSISRADVAAFLVEACESEVLVGKAIQLGG
ncbi:MAG TPA: NAD(P)-binding oxidoreductase [Anaeromyxobacter sp.]|nr:NAD(P)-binding oxidoreductase [Anaeromyxobacter sp.]